MRGPIALERRAAGEAPALQASSNALLFNVDDELQTLRGGVRVEAEGRVSEADELELDEQAGVAVLRGSPARSRDAEGEVSGEVLVYDLESNDVVVRGSVRATLTLEDGVGGAGAVAPAAEGAGEAGE